MGGANSAGHAASGALDPPAQEKETPVIDAETLATDADAKPDADPAEAVATRLLLEKLERHLRVATACLVVIALAVIYYVMVQLQSVLMPFVIAVALSYLLAPIVDVLSCRDSSCRWKLPHGLAVFFAIVVSIFLLFLLGLVLVDAVSEFAKEAADYEQRMQNIASFAIETVAWIEQQMHDLAQQQLSSAAAARAAVNVELGYPPPPPPALPLDAIAANSTASPLTTALNSITKQIDTTQLLFGALGSAAHIAEHTVLVVLFLVFIIAGRPQVRHEEGSFAERVDSQVKAYIGGKAIISCFVAGAHVAFLLFVGLHLWLSFGVLTFFLNFIPTFGFVIAVVLPMPLIALNPAFPPGLVALAFIGPLVCGIIAKDVLEPMIIGQRTALHPAVILLAIMLFGSVWGIVGMVLAVPVTAVVRICFLTADHALLRFFAKLLSDNRSSHHHPLPFNGTDASPVERSSSGRFLQRLAWPTPPARLDRSESQDYFRAAAGCEHANKYHPLHSQP